MSDLLAMNEKRVGSALEKMTPGQLMGLVDEVCTPYPLNLKPSLQNREGRPDRV